MTKRLNTADSLMMGDQLVMYRGNCTDFRALPFDILVKEILDLIPKPDFKTPELQRFNPNDNFTVDVDKNEVGTYLVINPSIAIDSGWINLPSVDIETDGYEVIVSCSEQINNLTIDGGDKAVIGEPNAINATGFFKMKYDDLSHTWYRVG